MAAGGFIRTRIRSRVKKNLYRARRRSRSRIFEIFTFPLLAEIRRRL
jgi:hypothetical protein